MADSNWVRETAQEIRENPAQFLREALKHEGFLADTEFKLHAEAGKPFVVRLEEADRPYLQIDYWKRSPNGGVILGQLVASHCTPYGETPARWTLNAHYQTVYHEGLPWSAVLEGGFSHMARCVWENDVASLLGRLGRNHKDSWLFPKGLHNQSEGGETILHASNY